VYTVIILGLTDDQHVVLSTSDYCSESRTFDVTLLCQESFSSRSFCRKREAGDFNRSTDRTSLAAYTRYIESTNFFLINFEPFFFNV